LPQDCTFWAVRVKVQLATVQTVLYVYLVYKENIKKKSEKGFINRGDSKKTFMDIQP
jgi:hypothetical protein